MKPLIERKDVTHWAVSGDRWCNVTGLINDALAEEWVAAGWRLVTRVTTRMVRVYGELET
jgi:hypothetical protein